MGEKKRNHAPREKTHQGPQLGMSRGCGEVLFVSSGGFGEVKEFRTFPSVMTGILE